MRVIQSILLFLLTISTTAIFGQLKQTEHFSKEELNGLCSRYIVLDSSGYFFKEDGCEGNSTISFGRYKVSKRNIVSFVPLPLDSLRPFKEIHQNKAANNGKLTFTFIDRDGKQLRKVYNYQVVEGNGLKGDFWSDDHDIIIQDTRFYEAILKPLVKGEENDIVVHMNIPTMFLANSQITFANTDLNDLSLKKDGLYDLHKKAKVYSRN